MNLKSTAIGLTKANDTQNETVRCSALANSAGRLRTWVGAIQLPESTTASHGIRNEAYNSNKLLHIVKEELTKKMSKV
jgi:hypothetical protein